MSNPLELFNLPGGLYPRRVTIYLHEKNLLYVPHLLKVTPVTQSGLKNHALGKPSGSSVPLLALGDGKFVRQSLAIIEYFEDICDSADNGSRTSEVEREIAIAGGPTMRGTTAEARARTRDILALAEEATTHFGTACHKGSAMFALIESQDATASRFAMESCRKTLGFVEAYYGDWEMAERVTIADCVLFALLQFASRFYGVDLWEGFDGLQKFYEAFEGRESVEDGKKLWEGELRKVAGRFLVDELSLLGRWKQNLGTVGVYVLVCARLLWGLVAGLWRK